MMYRLADLARLRSTELQVAPNSRAASCADRGTDHPCQEQEAYWTTDHQRLYKNKRPIGPRTIKDYTRKTRGLSDHGPLKNIQEQEASIQEQEAYQIKDHQRICKNKGLSDQGPLNAVQEQRSISPRTIRGYTRTKVHQSKDHQRLYKNQNTDEQFAGNWFRLMSSLARQMYTATVFPRDCKRLQQLG